jgi:hypothetical protein
MSQGILIGSFVKLVKDTPGGASRTLGLQRQGRIGKVVHIDVGNEPTINVYFDDNISLYSKNELSVVTRAPSQTPVTVPKIEVDIISKKLKENLTKSAIELDTSINTVQEIIKNLRLKRDIQKKINNTKPNPIAIRKIGLIDSLIGELEPKLTNALDNKKTQFDLQSKHNNKIRFSDSIKVSYISLTESVLSSIRELKDIITRAKNDARESRYLPGILTEFSGGKTRRNRRSKRHTLKASVRL